MVRLADDTNRGLCLSTFHADCIFLTARKDGQHFTLPQHVPCGLHQQTTSGKLPSASFASARFMRIASRPGGGSIQKCDLCLSTFHADCILRAMAQRGCSDCFASARFMRIASCAQRGQVPTVELCLSTFHADCINRCGVGVNSHLTLPQHVPCGLHLRG